MFRDPELLQEDANRVGMWQAAYASNPECVGPVDWAPAGAAKSPTAAIAKKPDLIVVKFIVKVSACSTPVGHGLFRHRKDRPDSVRVSDVEEHALR